MAVKNEQKLAEEMKETPISAPKVKTPQNEAKEKMTLVYIGPSLPAGWLKSNKVFTGTKLEIEKELETVLGKYPLVRKLLVPVSQLADKKEKARTPGNILNKYYSDVVSGIAAYESEV